MDHLGERKRVVEDIKGGRKGTRRKEIVERERCAGQWGEDPDRSSGDGRNYQRKSKQNMSVVSSRGHQFVLCVVKFGPGFFARGFL
jgi:hypothetical protein